MNAVYDSLTTIEGLSFSTQMIVFKQTNYNLALLFARRSLLNMMMNWPKGQTLFSNDAAKENFFKLVKILCNEAIFSSNALCNRKLLFDVANMLKHFLTHLEDYNLKETFVDEFLERMILTPVTQLEERWLKKTVKSSEKIFTQSKSTGE